MLSRLFSFLVALLVTLLTAQAATAASGSVGLTKSDKKSGSGVTEIVAAGQVSGVELFGFYDSNRYGEILAGRKFRFGENVSTTMYAGAEGLPGCGPKLRGMVITSAACRSSSLPDAPAIST